MTHTPPSPSFQEKAEKYADHYSDKNATPIDWRESVQAYTQGYRQAVEDVLALPKPFTLEAYKSAIRSLAGREG